MTVTFLLLLIWCLQTSYIISTTKDEILTYLIHSPQKTIESQQLEQLFHDHQIHFQKMKMVAFEHDFISPRKLKKTPDNLPANSKLDLVATQNRLKRRRDLTWKHISRWQSHLQIFLDVTFGDSLFGNGPYFIVEEVAQLTNQTIGIIHQQLLLQILPSDWELVIIDDYLHTCSHETFPRQLIEPLNTLTFCRVKSSFRLQAYIIRNPDVALKLVDSMNTRIPKEMDITISKLFEKGTVIAYAPIITNKNSSIEVVTT